MWVYVFSGLTSRCRTLVHAYYIMKENKNQKKLVIVWPLEWACGIHFREVFADEIFSDINFRVIEIGGKRFFDSTMDGIVACMKNRKYGQAIKAVFLHSMDYIYKIITQIRNKVPAFLFGKCFFDLTPPKETGWFSENALKYTKYISDKIQKALFEGRKIYIKAYNGILFDMDREKLDYSVIRFREEYWNKVKETVGSGGGYIGVHIRRTDHRIAIEESDTDSFIRKIDEICEKMPSMKIFLATDDKKEEQTLRNIYGNRLIVQSNKKWGRAGSEEMKSSVIDCLCLSRCECILGSSGSSYSSFAAKYGKKELFICSNETKSVMT